MKESAIILVGILLLVASAPAALAQLNLNAGSQFSMKDFTLMGTDPKGQNWRLHGTHTQFKGSTVLIEDVKLLFKLHSKLDSNKFIAPDDHQHVKVLLESDKCTFNSATKEIKSNAAIRVRIGRNITITGIGYDIDVEKKIILIRSAVGATMTMSSRSPSILRKKK